jgi:hypothetical protein
VGTEETVKGSDERTAPATGSSPVAGKGFDSPEALAAWLAENWVQGTRSLARGDLQRWAAADLGDPGLADDIATIQEHPGESLDAKLFRVILRLNPAHPPSCMGYSLTEEGLTTLAAAVAGGSPTQTAVDALTTVFRNNLLTAYADATGNERHRDIDTRWHEEFATWQRLLKQAHAAGAPDIFPIYAWRARARILDVLLRPEEEAALREEARAAMQTPATAPRGQVTVPPWLPTLGDPDEAGPGASLAMALLARAGAAQAAWQAARQPKRGRVWRRVAVLAVAAGAIVGIVLAFQGGGDSGPSTQARDEQAGGAGERTGVLQGINVLYTGVTVAPIDLLEAPEAGAAVVAPLPENTVVSVVSTEAADWYQVRIASEAEEEEPVTGWLERGAIRILCSGTCRVG